MMKKHSNNVKVCVPFLQQNWRESMVLRVHDCDELDVDLSDSSNGLAAEFKNSPVLLLEKIKALTITNLDAGKKGEGDDNDEETFSSIYIVESRIVDLPDELLFEDKADVLFRKVTVLGQQLKVTQPRQPVKQFSTSPR